MPAKHLVTAFLAAFLTLLASAQTESDSLTFVSTDWHWQDLGRGAAAGYASISIFDSVQSISVVRYPARRFRTSFVHAPAELSNTTDSIARRENARFAINGSYFNVRKLTPVTFFSQKRRIVGETADNELFRTDGVLARRHRCSRRFEIVPYESERNEWYRTHYYEALASGPILVTAGKSPDFDTNASFTRKRHPRSFFGTDGRYVYMVVIDGRFKGQGDGMSIPETAAVARWFGCTDAINLDGGGSSTLWTDRTGVINHPYDNHVFDHGGCRKVPNVIIVK